MNFSPELAEKIIIWIEDNCFVPEGKYVGTPVRLRDFQKDAIRKFFSTRTRTGILSFGRKNAKTALAAMLILAALAGPLRRVNGQCYSTALSRDQAAILFGLASKIVRLSPSLREVIAIKESAKELYCDELGILYKALSADAPTNLGKSPFFCVHDELGSTRGPRSALYEALETAMGAHEDPISLIISTQAEQDTDLLSILIDDARAGHDPRVKCILYSAPVDDDPWVEKTIRKANPAFGDFLNEEEVLDQAAKAKRMPSRESSYRNLILNQRVTFTNPLVPRSLWMGCRGEVTEHAFQGVVYGGLDLSARNDLTALLLIGKDTDGIWHIKADFWVPEDGLRDRAQRDRVPYDQWVNEGWIHATPGPTVDYEFVGARLAEIRESMPLQKVAYDRWRIKTLQKELMRMGVEEYPLEQFGQGYVSMSPAIDSLEALLLEKRLRHDGNPVLTWNVANAVATQDAAGNRKLDKAKATGRIDGIVALTMAIGVANTVVEDEYISGGFVVL